MIDLVAAGIEPDIPDQISMAVTWCLRQDPKLHGLLPGRIDRVHAHEYRPGATYPRLSVSTVLTKELRALSRRIKGTAEIGILLMIEKFDDVIRGEKEPGLGSLLTHIMTVVDAYPHLAVPLFSGERLALKPAEWDTSGWAPLRVPELPAVVTLGLLAAFPYRAAVATRKNFPRGE